MEGHKVVSRAEWIEARKAHLAKEKEFTRLRDQLSQERRDLPWEKVDKDYVFDGPNGKVRLADLFEGRSQLIVYHFMFDPAWTEGCKHCSFWADNFNSIIIHLNHRDTSMAAISHAPLEKLEAFKKRMGWGFKWLSAYNSDFNYNYHVSFKPEEMGKDVDYNFSTQKGNMTELPGISVFYKDETGTIFHTYSCYARGLDMLNVAYHYIDLTPKGRDEGGKPQSWVRFRDRYEA